MNQPWKIEEGLKLIRALQGRVKEFGYHIALGGGVLNTGSSEKDLDLYFLPLNSADIKEDTHGMLEWLTKLWGEPRTIGQYPDEPIQTGNSGRRLGATAMPRLDRVGGQWVVQRNPGPPQVAPPAPPQFLVNEDEPVPTPAVEYASNAQNDVEWARSLSAQPKKKRPESSYKYKLKFERAGNDRIDVFII